MNREEWLTLVAKSCEPLFRGYKVSEYRVTCGWPSAQALGRRSRRVGECHGANTSTAGVYELFISPLLDDSLEVAGTVIHELAHVVAGIKAGHGKEFVTVAHHAGLTRGKPAQIMPGKLLEEKLRGVLTSLGDYPHKKIVPVMREVKRKGGMIKLLCPCGAVAMMSARWLQSAGKPTCGCGTEMAPQVGVEEE